MIELNGNRGDPIRSDEDILELSGPPYYTACPNPFIADFIKPFDPSKPYIREPFNAHSCHTKVPHKVIMRYIRDIPEKAFPPLRHLPSDL